MESTNPFEKHLYEIDLVQGDVIMQVRSDDAEFMAVQMARWYKVFFEATTGGQVISNSVPLSLTPAEPVVTTPTVVDETPLFTEQASLTVSTDQKALEHQLSALTQPLPVLEEENFPGMDPVESIEQPQVSDFVQPAHQDMQINLQVPQVESLTEESDVPEASTEIPLPVFEQAVENEDKSVDNIPVAIQETLAETIEESSSAGNCEETQTPVQNPGFAATSADTSTLQATITEEPIAAEPKQDDAFDQILDTMLADAETIQPVSEVSDEMEAPAFKADIPEAFQINDPEALAEQARQIHYGETNLEDEKEEDELAAFESALEDALTTPKETDLEVEANDPFGLGIPSPPPSDDPGLKSLSLEGLQEVKTDFDSPFPAPDEEGHLVLPESHLQPAQDPSPSPVELPPLPFKAFELPPGIETLRDLGQLAQKATPGTDYLMLTAFYLVQLKQAEKFSLKEVNTELMRAGFTPVNHAMLETALNKGLLQLLPDMTGTALAAEYQLTEQGQEAVHRLLV